MGKVCFRKANGSPLERAFNLCLVVSVRHHGGVHGNRPLGGFSMGAMLVGAGKNGASRGGLTAIHAFAAANLLL